MIIIALVVELVSAGWRIEGAVPDVFQKTLKTENLIEHFFALVAELISAGWRIEGVSSRRLPKDIKN